MAPETFDLHTPASVLLRLPHLHSEVTSIPLAFTIPDSGGACAFLCLPPSGKLHID